jgi:hypothetical protein
LVVNATGFENLRISFDVEQVGDVEPCGDTLGDCWQLAENGVQLVAPTSIPSVGAGVVGFGPIPLTSANEVFTLTFTVTTSGSTEGGVFSNITITGDAIAP